MKRIFLVITLVASFLLTVFFFILFLQNEKEIPPASFSTADSIAPVTAITSPPQHIWQNSGFSVEMQDADLGSGLVQYIKGKQGCMYALEDLGTRKAVEGFRPCGQTDVFVAIGQNGVCSSSFDAQSGAGKCMVSSKAVDQAGNESLWQSVIFTVDFDAPFVGSITSVPLVINPGEEYYARALVSDNGKVTGCSLAVDGIMQEREVSFEQIPCQEDAQCAVSAPLGLFEPGEHAAWFLCQDSANNIKRGEPFSFEVFENHAPEISLCKVVPTTGTRATEFQFSVYATDPDDDALSFTWDFGDGTILDGQNPTHQYLGAGTYMPRAKVLDPLSREVSCSTAWVVVQEE